MILIPVFYIFSLPCRETQPLKRTALGSTPGKGICLTQLQTLKLKQLLQQRLATILQQQLYHYVHLHVQEY
jgi:hypothetical protein